MINDIQRIQISRSKYVEESRAIAVLRLNEYSFLKGEVVMLNYYKDPDFRNNIGVLVAIGVKDGIGENCYRLLSAGGTVVVRDVVDELPDISKLIHNELYIYKDEDSVWNYVYKTSGDVDRVIEPITGGPYIFIDLESGYRWFYEDQNCKREDDFFTTEEVKKILQDISDSQLQFSAVSTNGNLFKAGEVKSIIIQPLVVDKITGTDLTENCKYLVDSVELEKDEEGNLIVNGINKDCDITIVAEYPLINGIYSRYTSTVSIRFGYDFYYGPIDDGWQITKENIQGLSNNILNYRKDFSWDNITFSYKRIAVAYPKKYGYLNHILDDNGLDYIRTYQPIFSDVKIDQEEYIVYIKNDSVSVSEFLQKYIFNDTESMAIEEGNFFDMVDAWKKKNKFYGLVQLDEMGKIPSDLMNYSTTSEVFIVLTDIVTEYPTSGMEVGEVYYNSAEKKLFTALTETTGVISNPTKTCLYIFNNDYYTWNGSSLQKFSRVETIKLNKITDIFN